MALVHCDFFSESLRLSVSMDVILPQQTSTQIGLNGRIVKGDGHPTLYLLHGLSDDHTIWQRRTSIERYVASMGLAVVMPSAGRSFYCDMAAGGKYWTFVSEEVPALARRFFRLSARREDNFVAGLSMGGYGAFKAALRKPGCFAAAASLSGALDIRRWIGKKETEITELSDSIFGRPPRLKKGDDLFLAARELARIGKNLPRLYQCCGTEDYLYEDNQRFRILAGKLGLPLTYEEGPGAHEWGYWDRQIQRVLEWLPLRKRLK
ncbi:MAG: alpha/beta hydrolase family protein [Verrucomicrobiae bacterium]|nr:alpha/beta hydrolase family protein [Verrucomicrobiae bacterium]